MSIAELIAAKRDGRRLTDGEIEALVAAVTDGSASDAQLAAFCMAALLNGLDDGETGALTRAMTASGRQLSWPGLDGPVLDKHSTGGVGDKVSLILAPIIAAAGGYVPMIAGRGLGHTGGTIDKLEAIPGYGAEPPLDRFQAAVRRTGCAIGAATGELAPADRRLYGVRDVTATVESVPLIAASILSKKLAAGLDALVMDVKVGNGAFMSDRPGGRRLARALIDGAAASGLPVRALLTDMASVLGTTAGNAVEVREAAEMLATGTGDPRLLAVVRELAGTLLAQGGLAGDRPDGAARADRLLQSGAAAARFQAMVAELGGPADFLARPSQYLPAAPVTLDVAPLAGGYVAGQDGRALGQAVVALGGGRRRGDDAVDPAVGLTAIAGIGAEVAPQGRPLARVQARDGAAAEAAAERVRAAVTLAEAPPAPAPAVIEAG